MKKVLVFGTFDGLHEGHRAFLRQARAHGEHLTVVVADDDGVAQLKNRLPGKTLEDRMEMLRDVDLVDLVVPGDRELGTYDVLHKHRPDVVALGYDQKALKFDLQERARHFDWELDIVVLGPHQPEKYHNSIL